MKILVFSDSHTNVEIMTAVVTRETPDTVFHLGDHLDDAECLAALIDVPVHRVAGNTDNATFDKYELIVELGGRRFYLMHGHQFSLDLTWDRIREMFDFGVIKKVDVVLFGHTHEPFLGFRNNIWLFNPGRIGKQSNSYGSDTYGIITLNGNQISIETVENGL